MVQKVTTCSPRFTIPARAVCLHGSGVHEAEDFVRWAIDLRYERRPDPVLCPAALSLCIAFRPVDAMRASGFGASVAETTVRPDPRRATIETP